MNKLFLVLLFVSSSSLLLSQNTFNDNGERHGYWIGYHENGTIKYQGQFINGKEIGLFNYFDYSGNLVIRLNYIINGEKSQAELYHSNGNLKAEGEYVNKKKEGAWIYYNDKGQKISIQNYLHDKLHGECIYFYVNGMVAEKYIYFNNSKEGDAEIYYQSGSLNMTSSYNMNQLNGFASYYYDNSGGLESCGKYTMGFKDSIWIFYNELGKELKRINYIESDTLINK
mgnify:CR=1 FL=1